MDNLTTITIVLWVYLWGIFPFGQLGPVTLYYLAISEHPSIEADALLGSQYF